MAVNGIRRRETAEESSETFFQTSKLISSHFRREADKEKIYELTTKTDTLTNLLVSSSAIHAYHYLGIHTMDTLESGNVSVDNVQTIEKMEKQDLYNEINKLLGDSIEFEIKLADNEIIIYESILKKIRELQDEVPDSEMEEFREVLEDQLTEILHQFPGIFLYDYAADLLGYSDDIRSAIVENSSKLKVLAQEIEDQIIKEGRDDNYIELSLLKAIQDRMMKEFEFETLKILEMEQIPMRMLISKILRNIFNEFPTSKRGMDAYLEALAFKKQLISKFQDANKTKLDYELFEFDILGTIKTKIKEVATTKTSQELIYFLESVTGMTFKEVVDVFTRFGVTDIPEFVNIFKIDNKKFFGVLKLYGITKLDLVKIGNPMNNPIIMAESILREMKSELPELGEMTLTYLFDHNEGQNIDVAKEISNKVKVDFDEIKKLYKKRQILDTKIMANTQLSNYTALLILHDHEEILDNIAREMYFSLFSKITRQLSRILETFIKVKEDRSILLLALKKIVSTNEDWVAIKIEELVIQRLMKRQSELATIFNADRDPYLVNGFILARFLDHKLENAIDSLKKDPSSIYGEIKQLTLPNDMISPRSYCIAYDLLERYKISYEKHNLQIESVSQKEEAKKEIQKEEIKQVQQQNTFNWIDRKITGSMITISNKGINPTSLYWSEKDTQTCSDNLKLHSESKTASVVELFVEFYKFALIRMQIHWDKMKIPVDEELKTEVYEIISNEMVSRLNRKPNIDEIDKLIIEGDRWNAANKLSEIIGKKLDNILYKKFKTLMK